MKNESTRTPEYAKNTEYESVVERTNKLIESLPETSPGEIQHPILFITGLPRSGTTLLYQALAATRCFGYPTNFIARYYARPALGAQIQKLTEGWLAPGEMSFRSSAGNTAAWYEPHEFGYFWQRHFPFSEHHQPDSETLAALDTAPLARDFSELQQEFGGPLLFKNLLLDYVNSFIAETFPTSRFVYLRRPALQVAQSLLRLRQDYYGSESEWFSTRPRDADQYSGKSAIEQVAHQISSLRQALAETRSLLGPSRWIELEYEEFCSNPRQKVRELAAFVDVHVDDAALEALPEAFPQRSELTLPTEQVTLLEAALAGAEAV